MLLLIVSARIVFGLRFTGTSCPGSGVFIELPELLQPWFCAFGAHAHRPDRADRRHDPFLSDGHAFRAASSGDHAGEDQGLLERPSADVCRQVPQGLWFGGPGGTRTEVLVLAGLLVLGLVVTARTFRWTSGFELRALTYFRLPAFFSALSAASLP